MERKVKVMRFFSRNTRPLAVWAWMAAGSLVCCMVLWVSSEPQPIISSWLWHTFLLALSWGGLIGLWIGKRELDRHYRRKPYLHPDSG